MGISEDIPITKTFYSPITLLSIFMEDKLLKKLLNVVQLEIEISSFARCILDIPG